MALSRVVSEIFKAE